MKHRRICLTLLTLTMDGKILNWSSARSANYILGMYPIYLSISPRTGEDKIAADDHTFFTGEENPPPVCSVIGDSTVFGDAARENAGLIYRIMLSAAVCASTLYHKNCPLIFLSAGFLCVRKSVFK